MKKHLLSFAFFLGLVAAAAEPSLAARAIVGQEQRHDDHDKDHRKGQRAAHDGPAAFDERDSGHVAVVTHVGESVGDPAKTQHGSGGRIARRHPHPHQEHR